MPGSGRGLHRLSCKECEPVKMDCELVVLIASSVAYNVSSHRPSVAVNLSW